MHILRNAHDLVPIFLSSDFLTVTMYQMLIVCALIKLNVATLAPSQVPIEIKELFKPPLEEIAQVLNEGLKEYFKEVEVNVEDCPDLRQPPFTLANAGLNGGPRIVSYGDAQYLFPFVNFSKVYDLRHLLDILDFDSAFLFGASAGPYDHWGANCEGVFNINIAEDQIDQQSVVVRILNDGSYIVEKLRNNETEFNILGDYFVSKGKPGPVLKVYVKGRICEDSFTISIRKVLAEHYGDKIVGLGGTFILQTGQAWQSLVPEFSKTPLNTIEEFRNWLRYYNMSAPLIGVGMLVTGTCDLDLRLQHFHTFSDHGEAGHYNSDTTPEIAEYLGYFNTAEYVYRIDRAQSTKP